MSCTILRRTSPLYLGRAFRRLYSQTRRLTNAEVTKKRNSLFDAEKARQAALVTRVEKIQVEYRGVPEECSLLMNKNLSTPFSCAMHISELLVQQSVLALVNGEPWDIHRPLVEDCEIQFLHFKENDPSLVNLTFWRSCSFILGHVLETAFKDSYYVQLCSFPRPNVRSGSFICDADLDLPDWKPSSAELNCLSRIAARLGSEDTRFERLEVDASLAQQMFEDNRFKSLQIPAIAANSQTGTTITMYRMGDHIDISGGPLMASTKLLRRFSITAVHDIESPDFGKLKRVQGVAIPVQLPVGPSVLPFGIDFRVFRTEDKIHYWTFEKLCDRATKLNPAPVPTLRSNATVAPPAAESQPV